MPTRSWMLISSLFAATALGLPAPAAALPQDPPAAAEEELGDEVRVIRLRHRRAEALQATLRQLIAEDSQARRRNRKDASRRPVVIAHSESNSLLLSAAAEDFPSLEKLIRTLDEPGEEAAADPARPNSSINVRVEDNFVVLTPKGTMGVPLREFVDIASGLTGTSLVHHEPEIEHARIRFVGSLRVARESFFELFQTLLIAEGFVSIKHDLSTDVYEIVRHHHGQPAGQRARWVELPALEKNPFVAGSHVRTTVHLDSPAHTGMVQNVLGMAGQSADQATARALDDGKTFIVQGFAPRVLEIANALKSTDPTLPTTVVVRLEHANPSDIASVLVQLLVPPPGPTQGYPQRELRIAAMPPRSLVLRGTARAIREAQDLIARLDTKATADDNAKAK